MKSITEHINEKLQLNHNLAYKQEYKYFPETKNEFHKIFLEVLKEHLNTNQNGVLDLNNINVSELDNMQGLFFSNETNIYIKYLKHIDISQWDVSNVRDMSHMFYNTKLQTVGNLSRWNVSNVESMAYMFANCNKLKSIDISNWNTKSLHTMPGMFLNCSSLATTGDLHDLNVSSVDSMNLMFSQCSKLKNIGDISQWDLSNCTTISGMFIDCEKLEYAGDLELWETKIQNDCNCTNAFLGSGLEKPSWYHSK